MEGTARGHASSCVSGCNQQPQALRDKSRPLGTRKRTCVKSHSKKLPKSISGGSDSHFETIPHLASLVRPIARPRSFPPAPRTPPLALLAMAKARVESRRVASSCHDDWGSEVSKVLGLSPKLDKSEWASHLFRPHCKAPAEPGSRRSTVPVLFLSLLFPQSPGGCQRN